MTNSIDYPIASRIDEALTSYKEKTGTRLTWSDLTSKIGNSKSAPTQWKKDKIAKKTVEKISDILCVNYAWLLTGSGSMYEKELDMTGDIYDYSEVGKLYVSWFKLNNEATEIQEEISKAIPKPYDKFLPDTSAHEHLVELQKKAIMIQTQSVSVYAELLKKAKILSY